MELQINNITKEYGRIKALNGFSAVLNEGVYGLLGPNGSGKTTLINIITRIVPSTAGEIKFNGVDTVKLGKNYIKNIGYLPQYPKFYPNFKAEEFLRYICVMKNIPTKKHTEKIEQVLHTVNLDSFAKMRIGKFSGGMRQRLGIAQAIINDPKILILDEPTAGLDPQERIRFRNLISKLSAERIVLLSTHIVTDVEYIAKEVLLIKKGQLIAKKPPLELAESICGNVWTQEVPHEKISDLMNRFLISNAVYNTNSYTVKIISETQPSQNSESTVATLEDVYLNYFGEI